MSRLKVEGKHVSFGVQETDQVIAGRVDDVVCVTVRVARPRFEGRYNEAVAKAHAEPELRLYITKRRARSLITALSTALEERDVSL